MAIDLTKYAKLKERAQRAKSDYDKAEGVLQEQTRKLKEEFKVETLEDAEKLLKDLEKERDEAEKTYNEAFAAFEEKWGKL